MNKSMIEELEDRLTELLESEDHLSSQEVYELSDISKRLGRLSVYNAFGWEGEDE